jgi:hypothetical protein
MREGKEKTYETRTKIIFLAVCCLLLICNQILYVPAQAGVISSSNLNKETKINGFRAGGVYLQ